MRHLAAVGALRDVGGFAPRELRDRVHAGDRHRIVDAGGADVQRAAEDVGKAQRVVDLVRVIRTAGRDHRIGFGGARFFRGDLRRGIGECQDHRTVGHGRDHVALQHAARGDAQKYVGAFHDVGQRARFGLARVALQARVEPRPAFVQHAVLVAHEDVLRLHTEPHQHVEAGDPGGARTRRRDFHVTDLLADHDQCIGQRRADDDRGAVLVVVEYRDVHALAQLALDIEAFRRLDVLEVDAAEGRFERRDDLDQLVGVALVDFDVEYVDARELAEQHALAFHDGFSGQRADAAQTQHRGAVGDHAHQVAARGQRIRFHRVVDDRLARGGDAGRIGQRQVARRQQGFGGGDADFAGGWMPVVFQRGLFEFFGEAGHGERARTLRVGPFILTLRLPAYRGSTRVSYARKPAKVAAKAAVCGVMRAWIGAGFAGEYGFFASRASRGQATPRCA